MATFSSGTTVLDPTSVSPPAGLLRNVDNVGGIFHDDDPDANQVPSTSNTPKTATVVTGTGTILRGDNVVLATSSLGAFNGGMVDFNDSILYLNGDYTNRFAMDQSTNSDTAAATFRWRNGKIIMSGDYGTGFFDVFFRFRTLGGQTPIPVMTNTSFTRQVLTADDNNYPGFNMTAVPNGSDITGATFDGWWVNVPADLPLISIDFSNVGIRTSPNVTGLPYAVRINPRTLTTTNQLWINGSDLTGVGGVGTTGGQWAGGTFTNASFQLFGTGWSNAYEVWFVDCTFPGGTNPREGSLAVNLFTGAGNLTSPAVIRTLQAWRPRLQRPDLSLTQDAVVKAISNQLLQRCPTALAANAARVNAPTRELLSNTFTSGQPRGYFVRDSLVTLTNTGSSGTISYRNPNQLGNYVFASYTDLIVDGVYSYNMVNAGLDALGFPLEFDSKAAQVDPYVEGVTLASAPTGLTTALSTPNDIYRYFKRLTYEASTTHEWSNIFSVLSGGEVTVDGSLTMSQTANNDAILVPNPSILNARVGTSVNVSTSTGGTPITKINAINIGLGGSRMSGFDIESTASIMAPFYTNLAGATNPANNAFTNCRVTTPLLSTAGSLQVDGSAAGRVVVFGTDDVTQASTGNITSTNTTNVVSVANRPPGMTLGTGVQDAPIRLTYTGVAGDRISIFNNTGRLVTSTTSGTVEVTSDTAYMDTVTGSSSFTLANTESFYVAHSRVGALEQFTEFNFLTNRPSTTAVMLETDLSANTNTLTFPPGTPPAGAFNPATDVIWSGTGITQGTLETGQAAIPANCLVYRYYGLESGTAPATLAARSNVMLNLGKGTEAYTRAMYWFNRILTPAHRGDDVRVITNTALNGDQTRIFNTTAVDTGGQGVKLLPDVISTGVTQQQVDNVRIGGGGNAISVTVLVSTNGQFGVTFQFSDPASANAIGNAVNESFVRADIPTRTDLTAAQDAINTNTNNARDMINTNTTSARDDINSNIETLY